MARLPNVKPVRPAQRPARAPAVRKEPGRADRIVRYLRDVRTELSRVDWPSRKELVGSTLIVVVVLVVMALYLGAWDYIFTVVVRRWFVGPGA